MTAPRRGLALSGGSALAALPTISSGSGDGLGGFLRAVRRAANRDKTIAGGNRTTIHTRVEQELDFAP